MPSQTEYRKPFPALSTLRAFEAVGRLCGIRRAAQALQLNHAVVSRHLRSLEEWAGVPLIVRLRGRTELTDEGSRFHARIAAALGEIFDASAELQNRSSVRQLSIWCVPGFAFEWLTSRLSSFQKQHPEFQLELRSTDSSPAFARFEADVDIRYISGDAPVSAVHVSEGIRCFELARPSVIPVTSPGCAALLPPVNTPGDLLHAPLLHEENIQQWQNWFVAHSVAITGALPGPRLWHAHVTVDAARRGQGVALANAFLLGDDFATGRLVPLLRRYCEEHPVSLGAYTFAARADRWHSAAVASFRRWLRREMGAGRHDLNTAFIHGLR